MTNPRFEDHGSLLDTDGDRSGGGSGDELLHVVDMVRRRWWLLLAFGLVGLGVGAVLQSKLEPTFTSMVLIQRQMDAAGMTALGARLAYVTLQEDIESDLRRLETRGLIEAVVDSVGVRLLTPSDPTARGRYFADVWVSPLAETDDWELRRSGGDIVLFHHQRGEVARADAGGTIIGPSFRIVLRNPTEIPAGGLPFRVIDRNEAVIDVRDGLRASNERGTNLIRIGFTSTDPQLAADVANALAQAFIWRSAMNSREQRTRHREAVQARFAAVTDTLNAAQDLVLEFMDTTGTQNPQAEGAALSSTLQAERGDLRSLQDQQNQLESLVFTLQTGDREELRLMEIVMAALVPAAQPYYSQLVRLESERDQLINNPRAARTLTNPDVVRKDSQIAETIRQMQSITEQTLEVHKGRVAQQRSRVGELALQVGSVPEKRMALSRLERRVESLQKVHDMLSSTLYEAQIAEAVEVGNSQVIDAAVPRPTPDVVGQTRTLGLGFVLGLVIGFGVSLVLDRVDHRIRSPDEAPKLARAELLATIPIMRESGNGRRPLITGSDAASSEAFRMLRTNLRFVKAASPRLLQVTSPSPREGKSIITANLALTLAQEGKRVLVVDADLRRPVQHEIFGVSRAPGLTDILVGEAGSSAVHSLEEHRVAVVTAGTPSPRPAELLGSEAFAAFLKRSLEEYDILVVDAPPVLAVTDASVIGSSMDGVLLVGRLDRTDRQALSNAAEQLRRTRTPLLGVIVNGVSPGRRYGGSYGYGYGYGYESNGGPDSVGEPRKRLFGGVFGT